MSRNKEERSLMSRNKEERSLMSRNKEESSLMSRNKEESEILGNEFQVDLIDNGAGIEIESIEQDEMDRVEVDENPYLVDAINEDGYPGFHPYADASRTFEERAGIEVDSDEQEEEALGDDLADRIRQREDAVVGSGGSEIAMLQQVGEAHKDALSAVARNVRINPPSAYRALLGGKALCSPGQAPVEVINWVGDDVEATPVTITVSPYPAIYRGPAVAALTQTGFGFARIQWGTRDSLHTVDVDVGSGFQVTIAASVVYVSVFLDPLSKLLDNTKFGISASLGFFTGNRTRPLTYTDIFESTPPSINVEVTGASNAQATFNRPYFASHVKLLVGLSLPFPADMAALPPVLLSMFSLAGQNVVGGAAGFTSVPPGGEATVNFFAQLPSLQLPNDCVKVIVTQNIATFPLVGRLIWELAL